MDLFVRRMGAEALLFEQYSSSGPGDDISLGSWGRRMHVKGRVRCDREAV